jgi:hypothetical protein
MTDPSRKWFPRVCCPECYGPARVRLYDKEGRCRGCRPKRQHSQPRTDRRTNFAQFIARHEAANR